MIMRHRTNTTNPKTMRINLFTCSPDELSCFTSSSFSGFVGSVTLVILSPLSGTGSASGMGYVSVCSSSLSGVGCITGSLVVVSSFSGVGAGSESGVGYVSACSSPLSGVGFVTGSLVVVSSFSGVGGLKSYFLQTLERPFVFVHIKYLSSRQIIEQPSPRYSYKIWMLVPSYLFPSSHFSLPTTIPSPQMGVHELVVDPVQLKPFSTKQVEEHPSSIK